eukprot:1078975-Prymnesium_polylepis.1
MTPVLQLQLASRAAPVLASGDAQLMHMSVRKSISPVSSTSTGFRWCATASTASPTLLRTARLVLANAATGERRIGADTSSINAATTIVKISFSPAGCGPSTTSVARPSTLMYSAASPFQPTRPHIP